MTVARVAPARVASLCWTPTVMAASRPSTCIHAGAAAFSFTRVECASLRRPARDASARTFRASSSSASCVSAASAAYYCEYASWRGHTRLLRKYPHKSRVCVLRGEAAERFRRGPECVRARPPKMMEEMLRMAATEKNLTQDERP